MPDRLTPAQIRGARGMLNWSMLDLARAAGVSISTVRRCESIGDAAVPHATLGKVRESLQRGGVAFLADEGRGAGLRLELPAPPRASVFARFL